MILASRSPQRRALLDQVRIAYEVLVVDVEELEVGEPAAVAAENARRKALAGAQRAPAGALVLGVDTLVARDDVIHGKPHDEPHARRTLRALSGGLHEVHSGVASVRDGTLREAHVVTSVRFARLTDDLLAWYLATGEWRERAGAYAIQGAGAALVESIEGDYTNVVGLPIPALLGLHPELLESTVTAPAGR